jgi:hypothetical protein
MNHGIFSIKSGTADHKFMQSERLKCHLINLRQVTQFILNHGSEDAAAGTVALQQEPL